MKTWLLPLLLAACASTPVQAQCAMDTRDRAWLERALGLWQNAETEWLGLSSRELPVVLAIDAHCVHTLPAGRFDRVESRPVGPDGVPLGDQVIPIGPIAFADGSGRFVMSLPTVWQAAGVTSEVGLERLMEGVLLHEIMHTRQAALAAAAVDPIEASTDEEISDDRIQDVFANEPGYVASYQAERDALFAAAAAADQAEARRLAAEALRLMQARRAQWFTGERAHYRTLDDVFLTMEGVGQWLIYRHLTSPQGGGLSRDQALVQTRRGGRYWAQDEGLALILAVDRLVPDWRERAFREPDWRAEALLAEAVR